MRSGGEGEVNVVKEAACVRRDSGQPEKLALRASLAQLEQIVARAGIYFPVPKWSRCQAGDVVQTNNLCEGET
jgi:hypothetical protein